MAFAAPAAAEIQKAIGESGEEDFSAHKLT
jgi:hypothetical protein